MRCRQLLASVSGWHGQAWDTVTIEGKAICKIAGTTGVPGFELVRGERKMCKKKSVLIGQLCQSSGRKGLNEPKKGVERRCEAARLRPRSAGSNRTGT